MKYLPSSTIFVNDRPFGWFDALGEQMDSRTKPAYRTLDVAVEGGTLRAAVWGTRGPVVFCSHGITANHTEFQALADQLGGEMQLVAPDHRGRGRSNGIQGPWGMGAHAADVVAVLDQLGIKKIDLLLGHSMGGFVAAVAAARYPDRVNQILLVDGGIPLADFSFVRFLPFSNWVTERLVRKILGPSMTRLDMTFDSHDSHVAFWKKHPALTGDQWSDYMEQYIAYDESGTPPKLRSSMHRDALWQDVRTQLVETLVSESLAKIGSPVRMLRAPRGILGAKPLYPERSLAKKTATIKHFSCRTLNDVNHFTILISEHGARQVADEVRALLNGSAA